MSGTSAGGKKTAIKNKQKHGDDFYSRLGKKGGLVKHPKTRWFALHPELAKISGRKGGKISKRGKAK